MLKAEEGIYPTRPDRKVTSNETSYYFPIEQSLTAKIMQHK